MFKVAEIANFNKHELDNYEESKKHNRDLNNVLNTAKREGREEERIIQEKLREEERIKQEKTIDELKKQIDELKKKK